MLRVYFMVPSPGAVTIIINKFKSYVIAKAWERMTSFLQFNYY